MSIEQIVCAVAAILIVSFRVWVGFQKPEPVSDVALMQVLLGAQIRGGEISEGSEFDLAHSDAISWALRLKLLCSGGPTSTGYRLTSKGEKLLSDPGQALALRLARMIVVTPRSPFRAASATRSTRAR